MSLTKSATCIEGVYVVPVSFRLFNLELVPSVVITPGDARLVDVTTVEQPSEDLEERLS